MRSEPSALCPCGSGRPFNRCCGRGVSPDVRQRVPELINQAIGFQRGGDLQRAEEIYRSVLEVEPRHSDALHLLGVIMLQRNDPEGAIGFIKNAIASRPGIAMYHNNLGAALRRVGLIGEALAQFGRALDLEPGMVDAMYNQGEALGCLGRNEQAIGILQKVVALNPGHVDAYLQLGNIQAASARSAEAMNNYRQAIRLSPGNAPAYKGLAVSLHRLSRPREAIDQYRKAISLYPEDAEVWSNLSDICLSLGEIDESEICLRRALNIDPNMPAAHNNLGNLLKSKGNVDEAVACYRRAIELAPDFSGAHSNLLLCLNYMLDYPREKMLEEHKAWERAHGLPLRATLQFDHDPDRKLRVGYVSSDLRSHAVAYFVEALLEYHDAGRYEVICYADIVRSDEVTERFKGYVENWRDTHGWDDARLIDAIKSDGVDILVDLGGHTANSRLAVFTAKPAPLQVSYIGYANTSGLTAIDYRLTDELTDPPQDQRFYTEKLIYLENGFSCYTPPRAIPEVSAPPCSSVGYVTFGSFNNLFKMNDAVIDLWCRVLHACPESHLRIFRHTLKGSVREGLWQSFERHGIDRCRLDFWGEVPQKHLGLPPGLQHMGMYEDIDISLDTFPWNGHTTSCESLWMGVPVITLFGTRHAGRICASILRAAGLSWLVAKSADDYVDIAARLAADWAGLAELRKNLREQLRNSPLCNGREFVLAVEGAYREMWRERVAV